ncbi:MAG: hypothetical protein ACTIKR_03195 [Advenella sp.]|uniref:hypothetical protein n=1 Tax=Advenella sp. TaxID=1872388 RepID=UPI003F9B29DB
MEQRLGIDCARDKWRALQKLFCKCEVYRGMVQSAPSGKTHSNRSRPMTIEISPHLINGVARPRSMLGIVISHENFFERAFHSHQIVLVFPKLPIFKNSHPNNWDL